MPIQTLNLYDVLVQRTSKSDKSGANLGGQYAAENFQAAVELAIAATREGMKDIDKHHTDINYVMFSCAYKGQIQIDTGHIPLSIRRPGVFGKMGESPIELETFSTDSPVVTGPNAADNKSGFFGPRGEEIKTAEDIERIQQYAREKLAPSLGIVAERMFNAYNEQAPNPWKTFDGRDVPRWNDLNDQVRAKWTAAAAAAFKLI